MKKLNVLLATLFLSTAAMASHWGEYGEEEVRLTNKLFELCADEVSQLMNQSYTRITAGSFVGGMTPEGVSTSYTFTFVQTFPAPSFDTRTWELTAVEKVTQMKPPIPADHSGREVKVDCSVQAIASQR